MADMTAGPASAERHQYLVRTSTDQQADRAEFTSVTGQDAFPPEAASSFWCPRSVQLARNLESASELHYARQLEEVTAQDRMVSAFERIAGEGDDD
jgi:hypothetical protein